MFLTMAIGFGGTATVWADEPTKPSDGSEQGVQERAVPEMRIPGVVPGATLAPKPEGVIIQGNRLTAAPGFVLQKGPNNTVSAKRAGGASSGSWSCSCKGTGGSCDGSSSGDVAVCSKSPSGPCVGECQWKLGVSGAVGRLPDRLVKKTWHVSTTR